METIGEPLPLLYVCCIPKGFTPARALSLSSFLVSRPQNPATFPRAMALNPSELSAALGNWMPQSVRGYCGNDLSRLNLEKPFDQVRLAIGRSTWVAPARLRSAEWTQKSAASQVLLLTETSQIEGLMICVALAFSI